MRLQLSFEALLVDVARLQLAGRHFCRELARRCGDFGARAVIQGDDKSQPCVRRRTLNSTIEPRHKLGPEAGLISDQLALDLLLLDRLELAFEVKTHERGEVGNFLAAARP